MTNQELFSQAIADAKAVRDAAVANAKAALEETFTPKIMSMLSAKLNELEEEGLEEKMEKEEEGYKKEEGHEAEIGFGAASQKPQIEGEMEEADNMEEADLEEILAQLEAEEKGKKEEGKDEMEEAKKKDMEEGKKEVEEAKKKDNNKKEKVEESLEEAEGDDEMTELTVDELKDIIRDVLKDVMGGAEEAGEEELEMNDEAGEEEETEDEESISLDELLAELDKEEEGKKVEEKKEVEKKKEKVEEAVEEVEEGISDVKNFFLKVADDIKKGLGFACVAEYNAAIKAGKSDKEARIIYDTCLSGEKGGFQGPSVTKATSGIAEKKDEMEEAKKDLEEAISTIKTLQAELNEVNLLNAKLLYTNKIFKAKSLNEAQKVKVLKAFDKATNVSEVKTVYNTLSESFETKTKTTIKESVGFASKAVGVAPAQPIVEGDAAIRRMQQLAGIVK